MAIQFYHVDDDGVPNYTSGGSNAQNFASFKILLLACLVNGYGSKPAAGWELVAEGSNHLVLRTGNHSGYVGFQLVGEGVRIWLAQTFIEMNGSVMAGDGLKSGVAANNGTPQFKSLYGIATTGNAGHSWFAVADEKTAIFCFSGQFSGADQVIADLNGTEGSCGILYFGEDDRGNIVSCGGVNTTSTTAGTVRNSLFDSGGFTALRDPATGLLIDTGSISVTVTPGARLATNTWKDNSFRGVFERAIFTPVMWGANGVWSQFRGVVDDARLTRLSSHAMARALGLSAGLTFGTLNTPLPLDGPYQYWVGPLAGNSASNGPARIITSNPEFW